MVAAHDPARHYEYVGHAAALLTFGFSLGVKMGGLQISQSFRTTASPSVVLHSMMRWEVSRIQRWQNLIV